MPASKTAGVDLGGTIVLDVYAMLIIAHSEKEQAAATFKHGFGFHPIAVWCDNTYELSRSCCGLVPAAIMPKPHRNLGIGDRSKFLRLIVKRLLVRADGAGASHQLLDWLTAQGRSAAGGWSTRSGSPLRTRRRSAPSPGCRPGRGRRRSRRRRGS